VTPPEAPEPGVDGDKGVDGVTGAPAATLSGEASWWAHLRAALALVWLLSCVVAAIPDLDRAKATANWKDPRVIDELSVWAEALGQEPTAFVATLKMIAERGAAIRGVIMTPFKPILKATGIRQSWVVFIAGTRQADRFEVTGHHVDGRAERLYLRGDDTAQWRARLIEGSRFRNATFLAAWPDKRGRRHRASVCHILATRAFDDDKTIDAVTCAFLRRRNVKPGEGPVPTEKRVYETTVTWAALQASQATRAP
jgi:hypothetical protein